MYPPKLNLEQTSSEITAKYKASLVQGKSIIDVTGGFGVDSYYFSERFEAVYHFDTNKDLSIIAIHNFKKLKKNNIQSFSEDGIIAATKQKYNVIYVDPSRRNSSKGKVFFLKDCTPNIPENLGELLKQCETLLIKTSPMLDISVGINELKYVSQIHIIAINNEVKELLWLVKPNYEGAVTVKTINFSKQEIQEFEFTKGDIAITNYTAPKTYLYEPNAAILKSGAFNLLPSKYKVSKLEKHSHLYTNEQLVEFPGRRFLIKKVVPYSKKEMNESIVFNKANITTRNFPESVDSLRKKWKIKDGGSVYLFFTTLLGGEKMMLVCERIS